MKYDKMQVNYSVLLYMTWCKPVNVYMLSETKTIQFKTKLVAKCNKISNTAFVPLSVSRIGDSDKWAWIGPLHKLLGCPNVL